MMTMMYNDNSEVGARNKRCSLNKRIGTFSLLSKYLYERKMGGRNILRWFNGWVGKIFIVL